MWNYGYRPPSGHALPQPGYFKVGVNLVCSIYGTIFWAQAYFKRAAKLLILASYMFIILVSTTLEPFIEKYHFIIFSWMGEEYHYSSIILSN